MKDHELPSIAQKAIEHLLRYHDSCHTGLTDLHKDIIKQRIEALLPLKSLAADNDVANIEIVSDAAMSFLDVYNLEHLENPLNHKWLYIGVQTLASIDLKPALVSGEVRRLSEASIETETRAIDSSPDRHDMSQPDETEAHDIADPNDIHHNPPTAPASNTDDRPREEQASAGGEESPSVKTTRSRRKRRSSGSQAANGNDPWGDEEIMKLIKWKVQGMTHKEVGARLGRSEPACAIRHSIVLKQDRWIEFARAYREKRAAGETSDAEGENEIEIGEKDELAKEDEEMKEPEEQEDSCEMS
ncbi:hypothetical protein INS49_009662 [Diaporthe citri]|uniref:uncharacterized protein n=1 Tax=Diaporthe citri TaxID=83186 RepID=UPI001C7FAB8D|nr:uncharacterized protein INS49_009662 [Diaporthe citri]KAG6361435.1 hypothetical protein INS49_009662 [Diaporthe citri]